MIHYPIHDLTTQKRKKMINNNTNISEVSNPQQIVQNLFKSYTTSKIDSILKYIQLGVTLVDMKKTLKKQFYNVIDEKIMPKKEVTRAMKFVLSIESNKNYREAMKTTNNVFSTLKRLELFELDTRIKDLTDKDLEHMHKPSVSKFNKMKVLNDDDFQKVLSGNDEPLLLNTKDTDAEDKYKYKPTEMPSNEYDSIVKAGIKPIITEYWQVKKEKESLVEQLKQHKATITQLQEDFEAYKLQNSNMDVA